MFASNTSAANGAATYIEDVFSTTLYTGNGSTQTITNGIDLAGKGGMVWVKARNQAYEHFLYDTLRGAGKGLNTNLTDAQGNNLNNLSGFLSSGFSVGAGAACNQSGTTYASWTFRKQPKFFDVVTYTGNGASNRAISHNLESTPGCVIVKRVSAAENWIVWHRSISAANKMLVLNSTGAQTGSLIAFDNSLFTSTTFGVNNDTSSNNSGDTYVAYLFAHNAGGFGLTGTDNVISCGSYTGNGSAAGPVVTLGYEPQWVLIKRISTAGTDWNLIDNMRGFIVGANGDAELYPNSLAAENPAATAIDPLPTGFQVTTTAGAYNLSGGTYIYIAIRRGPMKTPTSGTTVFAPVSRAGNSTAGTLVSAGFPVDIAFIHRANGIANWCWEDRLRGSYQSLATNNTNAENNTGATTVNFNNSTNSVALGTNSEVNSSLYNYINYFFRRAPGFFDEVCYTGNVTQRNINHNLTVIPELFIVKSRSAAAAWYVSYYKSSTQDMEGYLNTTDALTTRDWSSGNFGAASTATTFSVGPYTDINASGQTYVAYLFASCPGVSKVGSYTGTGTTQQINCGFTAGARFVLIKRTDSAGDWYVWDTARGIVAGNDPYLLLNSTAAEVTSTDYVDTYSAGFEISSTAPAAINASGGTFIYLAIA